MNWKPADLYLQPRYYDIVFDEDSELEADFLRDVYERFVGPSGAQRLLEPACGSGRLMVALARRGFTVHGFDHSEAMVSYARKRARRVRERTRVFDGSMTDFDAPGPYDMAYCLVSTFKYLLSEDAARRHLSLVARHLAPGGIYVLGFHLADYGATAYTHERYVGERRGTHVTCNIRGWPADRATRRERLRCRLTVRKGDAVERWEDHWTFRTYSEQQFRGLLKTVPELELEERYGFDYDVDQPLRDPEDCSDFNVVLRKR